MSREGGHGQMGGREGASNVVSQPFPPFYPVMGYQGTPQTWYPFHPNTGAPAPWGPSWNPALGYPAPTPPWSGQQAPAPTLTASTTANSSSPDEYTVDTLRRVYSDDGGRVEIQRVKVRRHQEPGTVAIPPGPEVMSVIPVGTFPLNERRPPPRKNRRKQQLPAVTSAPGPTGPYPWYPYMPPCVPYPYHPYPYYMDQCMWPPYVPQTSVSNWSGNESERAFSRQDSLPATLDSQRLESRASLPSQGSLSPTLTRSPSPSAASHITDIHSLAPSDSVSMRGLKRDPELERILRSPTPPPRTRSRASSDKSISDVGKTQGWMLGLQCALAASGDVISEGNEQSSNMVIYNKIPPVRKRRKMKGNNLSDRGDMESISDMQSVVSDVTFDDSLKLSSELTYAFRKFERSVDAFKSEISTESSLVHSSAPSPSVEILHSSGDITPTERSKTAPPISDIALLTNNDQLMRQSGDDLTLRTVSPSSISSLPSLKTPRTDTFSHPSAPMSSHSHAPMSSHSHAPMPSYPQLPPDTGNTDTTTTTSISSATPKTPPTTTKSPSPEAPTEQGSQTPSTSTSSDATTPSSVVDRSLHLVSSTPEAQPTPAQATEQPKAVTVQPASLPNQASSPASSSEKPSVVLAMQTSSVGVQENDTATDKSASVTATIGPVTATGTEVPATTDKLVTVTTRTAPGETSDKPSPKPDTEAAPAAPPPTGTGTEHKGVWGDVEAGKAAEGEEGVASPKAIVKVGGAGAGGPAGAAPADGGAEGVREAGGGSEGRESRASITSSFFSTRPPDYVLALDTDSTDIPLPTTDTATADEEEVQQATTGGESHWVLQGPGDTPLLTSTLEPRDAWRAEVSLWRARLVVSLCRGRGLDRQDWATFHLMIHHPLTLDLKLSLLHAPRLCAANTSTGAAVVRVAALHLAQYGEALLQPEATRQPGWRALHLDPALPWAPVKGAVEVLLSLGYLLEEDKGMLRYPRRGGPEVSVVARLTLDLLVLGEELRLYLTGTHQYPANISRLFLTGSPASPVAQDLPQRPPSSTGSFVSATSEAPAPASVRPDSRASITTDDDTETLHASARQVNAQTKDIHRKSSSEEDVTLKGDLDDKAPSKQDLTEAVKVESKQPTQVLPQPPAVPPSTDVPRPGSTMSLSTIPDDRSFISTNMTSLPDLVSIISSSTSELNTPNRASIASSSNDTVTPVASPAPPTTEVAAADNPEEHVYEEIDVIRAQVQALRASSVPTESAPPPLPPKKKVSSSGEDDSGLSLTYPQVEWTSASMPGSLRGGSTGARRKKRRAPMPPEFMAPNWKQSQSKAEESADQTTQAENNNENDAKKSAEYRRSLNPFYEELESLEEKAVATDVNTIYKPKSDVTDNKSDVNPFLEKKVAVAGFIGKNPFYEDVAALRKSMGQQDTSGGQSQPDQQEAGPVCAMGSLSQLQDDSVIVRPKRRAPKPPATSQPTTPQPATRQSKSGTPQPSVPQPESATSKQKSVTPEPVKSQAYIQPQSPEQAQNKDNIGEVAATSTTIPRTLPNVEKTAVETQNTDTEMAGKDMTQNTSSSISLEAKCESAGLQVSHQAEEKSEQKSEFTNGLGKLNTVKRERDSHDISEKAKENGAIASLKEEADSKTKTIQPEESADKFQQSGDNTAADKEASVSTIHVDVQEESKSEEAKPTSPKLGQSAQQRKSLHHPKNPPPPPPAAAKMEDAEVHNTTKSETSSPASPPQKPTAPPSLVEEIPYMDANEVKYAKAKKLPPHHRYFKREAPGAPTLPPVSPTISRQSSLLLGIMGNVPFIDDSDLPPNCPPPLPPGSPPESPLETLHTSPPETPHTSPPETPHDSPSLARRASPSRLLPAPASPLLRPAPTISTKKESLDRKETEKNVESAPPVPLMTSNEMAPAPMGWKPSVLPPKNSLQQTHTQTQAQSHSDTTEPLLGKHSVQRSMSEERYEIPDTSRAPPPRPPPHPKSQPFQSPSPAAPEPYTAPSECDRYEVPEAPRELTEAHKVPETEERYEIPEVVKEAPLKKGANGAPCSVVLGRTISARQGDLHTVFGPPKPPRQRRKHQSPPPRPPKSAAVTESSKTISTSTARPPSATSSFSSSSRGTGSSVPTPRPHNTTRHKPKRRSWPFLLCDCLYVNCRTYDDAGKS